VSLYGVRVEGPCLSILLRCSIEENRAILDRLAR
jgi:hypothetical protein